MKTGVATCTFVRSDNRQTVHEGYPVHGPDALIDTWRRRGLLCQVEPGTEGFSMIVTALATFSHGGKTYRKGDTPNIVSTAAYELAGKGLVSLVGMPTAHPPQASGKAAPSSALPRGPASQQMTSSESETGEKLTKRQRRLQEKQAREAQEAGASS